MKELYLDSANIEEIITMVASDAVSGVTTNPSLMAKEMKGGYTERLMEICEAIEQHGSSKKHLSVEVTSTDPREMLCQAKTLREALKGYKKVDLHVKIPFMLSTLPVITDLISGTERVKVNATAIITTGQAKLAHDAGADIVSFFYRRGMDHSEDMDRHIRHFVGKYKRNCRVICGSIREPRDILDCWDDGAEIVTAPMSVIKQMSEHVKTTEAIQKFQKDIESWLS